MNEVGIFGKKGSIAKYDLSENKPIWVGIIEAGHAPYSISQYKNFVLVFSYTKWGTKPMIHCFDEKSGMLLWQTMAKLLLASGYPFFPHYYDGSLYLSLIHI